MKAGRILLMIFLLVAGFIAGQAWKKSDHDTTAQPQGQPVVQGTPVSIPASTVRTLTEHEQATIRLFEESAPSVAFITSINLQRDYWSRNVMEIPQGTGSGFVWDKEGHVVTNFHVIREGQRAQVTLSDQSTWPAEIIGYAAEKDLAVLKINAPREKLIPIAVGSSADLMVGQSVFAIGNPFGLDHSLTTGVISALGREIQSLAGVPIRDAIQTDAAINPGNSGGPLLDSSGKLIGVNTQIYSPSGANAGIGFAIPADEVRWVVPDLIEFGEVRRPVLGVELVAMNTTDRMGLKGALILDVVPGGAAEKAGIQPTRRNNRGEIEIGDLVVAVNNEKVNSNADLILALEKHQPGQEVRTSVMRNGKQVDVQVKLGGK
jgi:S1-C subfamily serine protease